MIISLWHYHLLLVQIVNICSHHSSHIREEVNLFSENFEILWFVTDLEARSGEQIYEILYLGYKQQAYPQKIVWRWGVEIPPVLPFCFSVLKWKSDSIYSLSSSSSCPHEQKNMSDLNWAQTCWHEVTTFRKNWLIFPSVFLECLPTQIFHWELPKSVKTRCYIKMLRFSGPFWIMDRGIRMEKQSLGHLCKIGNDGKLWQLL